MIHVPIYLILITEYECKENFVNTTKIDVNYGLTKRSTVYLYSILYTIM